MVVKREIENLGEMLLREGLINNDQLEEALKRRKATEKSLGHILVEMGVITESVKMSFMRKKFGYEFFSLGDKRIDVLTLSYIPKPYAHKYHLVPVQVERGTLVVGMDHPSDLTLLDNLKTLVGMPIRPVIASSTDIDEVLEQYPEEKGYAGIPTPPSLIYRAVRYVAFPILGFLPLIVFIALLGFSEGFRRKVNSVAGAEFSFDVFLYTLLGWGLWIIIVWEINGLIFQEKRKSEVYAPPEKEESEE